MDEEGISQAIDRLNRELPPGGGDAEILAAARAIRGLREPLWPDDPAAFEARLLPRAHRHWRAATGVAAAALLLAALVFRPGHPLMASQVALSGFAVSAPPLVTERAAAAPTFAAADTGATHAPAQTLTLQVLEVSRVGGSQPAIVVRIRLPEGGRPLSVGQLTDLYGHFAQVRMRVRREGAGNGAAWSLRLPAPRAPGWYLLDAGNFAQRVAFLLPYAPGSTYHGHFGGRTPVRVGVGTATLLSVDYSAQDTRVRISVTPGLGTPAARLEVPGSGSAFPLDMRAHGAGVYSLTFDPLSLRTGGVRLQLQFGSAGVAFPLRRP